MIDVKHFPRNRFITGLVALSGVNILPIEVQEILSGETPKDVDAHTTTLVQEYAQLYKSTTEILKDKSILLDDMSAPSCPDSALKYGIAITSMLLQVKPYTLLCAVTAFVSGNANARAYGYKGYFMISKESIANLPQMCNKLDSTALAEWLTVEVNKWNTCEVNS